MLHEKNHIYALKLSIIYLILRKKSPLLLNKGVHDALRFHSEVVFTVRDMAVLGADKYRIQTNINQNVFAEGWFVGMAVNSILVCSLTLLVPLSCLILLHSSGAPPGLVTWPACENDDNTGEPQHLVPDEVNRGTIENL